jgi:hypothetical protein
MDTKRSRTPNQTEKPMHTAENQHSIAYAVNGDDETTTERELTVKTILENAGFTPASDYTLSSENPPRTYSDQNEMVKIHPNQHFNALFTGPTPTS